MCWCRSVSVGGAMGQEQGRVAPPDLRQAADQGMGGSTPTHVWRDHPLLPGVSLQQLHTGKVAPPTGASWELWGAAPSVLHPKGSTFWDVDSEWVDSSHNTPHWLKDKVLSLRRHLFLFWTQKDAEHTADGAEHYQWMILQMCVRSQRCLMSAFCFSAVKICVTCLRLVLQGSSEHFLVLFSFHLLILSLDHSRQEFIYEVFFVDFT